MVHMPGDATTDLFQELARGRAEVEPITVDQYHRMLEAGILEEGAPVELLDGMLVRKDRAAAGEPGVTVSPRHSSVVQRLARLEPRLRPMGCYVQIQGPIAIPMHQEPEPDGAVVRGAPEDYQARHPGPSDVRCVIEVADSSVQRDRMTKQRIYATAGIPQYIIVNLTDGQVEVYTHPDATGRYQSRVDSTAGESVQLDVVDGRRIRVAADDWLS